MKDYLVINYINSYITIDKKVYEMNKKIINANSARITVQVSSETMVQEEIAKINDLIESASSQGDFEAFWKIPSYLNEKQLNIVMDFLADSEYTMFFKKQNTAKKIVKQVKREVPDKIADIFNPSDDFIIIDWKLSRDENIQMYHYFDMFKPENSNFVANIK